MVHIEEVMIFFVFVGIIFTIYFILSSFRMGPTIDKFIDGIRDTINKMFDFLPIWAFKTVRVVWYIIYAALIIYIFSHYTD